MDDDLFTDDELGLDEQGADEADSPRTAIASQPIRDGSRALLHDGYDVQTFRRRGRVPETGQADRHFP
jgi:hypothetical protein